MALTISARRVLLHEHDNLVIRPARIHVLGSRITRVELTSEPGTLDFGERLITPAFVNAHTHLALAFLRGVEASGARRNLVEDLYFAFESRLTPEDIRAFARMGAYESLLAGVGLVWDHYYGGSAVAEALLDTGLCGVVAPTVQDLAGPDRDGSETALDITLQLAASARHHAAGVFAALGPHATDTVSPALLRRIGELADQHELPIHMHVAQSYDELARVEQREGRTPLALLAREGVLDRAPSVVLAHALFATVQDLQALDPGRHTLVFCPSSQMQFGFPAPVPLWGELGVSWVVATDCASSNDSMNLQKELRLCHGAASTPVASGLDYASFLESGEATYAREVWNSRSERNAAWAKHVTSERLLERVWSRAGALHPAFRAGVIADGALANVAVWDTDHPAFWPGLDLPRALALSDTTQALHAMIVGGRVLGEPGRLVQSVLGSDSYRESLREASGRLDALLR
ncbi:MAG TPA: amidohydrolase family protein [Polyangiales bacterium]|nr:amidohydrolase family protein [Polyangiales bacterium]